MHLLTLTLTLTLLLTTILPTYALATLPYHTPNATNTTIMPPSRYYLKTRVLGSSNRDKDGLYITAYHTGAAQNDIALESIELAATGLLNGTYQQFDLGGGDIPWGLFLGVYDNYASWDFASINAGYGSEGFFFNRSGLQFAGNGGGFAGWIACDWWHGVPQLFWKAAIDVTLPDSCAMVELVPAGV